MQSFARKLLTHRCCNTACQHCVQDVYPDGDRRQLRFAAAGVVQGYKSALVPRMLRVPITFRPAAIGPWSGSVRKHSDSMAMSNSGCTLLDRDSNSTARATLHQDVLRHHVCVCAWGQVASAQGCTTQWTESKNVSCFTCLGCDQLGRQRDGARDGPAVGQRDDRTNLRQRGR